MPNCCGLASGSFTTPWELNALSFGKNGVT